MSKVKFNRFTRGVFLAFAVLMLGLGLDIGKAVALHSVPLPTLASVLASSTIQAGNVSQVALPPARISLPSGLPAGTAILTKYHLDTRRHGNVAITTITQTYKISSPRPQMGRHWFFALVGAKVAQWMSHQATGQDLSAKTG